jgi:acyl-coenzyme A thioesterase PaaI-like protein
VHSHGLVCTLLDSATGCAEQSALPQAAGSTSVEIKVNYLKPVRLSDRALFPVRVWFTRRCDPFDQGF